jgi:hypothetical protein
MSRCPAVRDRKIIKREEKKGDIRKKRESQRQNGKQEHINYKTEEKDAKSGEFRVHIDASRERKNI